MSPKFKQLLIETACEIAAVRELATYLDKKADIDVYRVQKRRIKRAQILISLLPKHAQSTAQEKLNDAVGRPSVEESQPSNGPRVSLL